MPHRRTLLAWSALAAFWLPAARVLAQSAPGAGPGAAPGSYRELKWDALVPKGWDPMREFPALRGGASRLGLLGDGDPQVQSLMKQMRQVWDNAPTVPELDGVAVRLPGYVVPLETAKDGGLKEFLLVPYFGACIHTPPPPANQIVHVKTARAVAGVRSMDAVWVSGTLKGGRQDSAMGTSGYRMTADLVVPYEAPR
jgi:hypothetical protein